MRPCARPAKAERGRREGVDRHCRFVVSWVSESLNRPKYIRHRARWSGLVHHGPKCNGKSGSFHSGNTVLPFLSGGTRHHVEGPRSRIERKALPFVTRGPPE